MNLKPWAKSVTGAGAPAVIALLTYLAVKYLEVPTDAAVALAGVLGPIVTGWLVYLVPNQPARPVTLPEGPGQEPESQE